MYRNSPGDPFRHCRSGITSTLRTEAFLRQHAFVAPGQIPKPLKDRKEYPQHQETPISYVLLKVPSANLASKYDYNTGKYCKILIELF